MQTKNVQKFTEGCMTNSQISSLERKIRQDILEKKSQLRVRARQNYCFKKIEGAWPTVNFLTGV